MIHLLHLHRTYKHARHWTPDNQLDARLAAHEAGRGARLTQVVGAAGIGWELARTWPGGRVRERQLKRQGGASRLCPLCGVTPRSPQARPKMARSTRAAAAEGLNLPLNTTAGLGGQL